MTLARKGSLLGAILITGSTLAGCSEASPGDPRPTNANSSSTATTEPSGKPTSERPREIKLNGQDPCSLIPQADWAKFELEKPGKPGVNPASKEPLCGYNSGGLATFDLTLNSKEGIEVWDEGKRSIHIEGTEAILGFPAIHFTQSSPKSACSVAVDVADGQTLDILVIVSSREALPRKCEIAREIAESAMKTLLGGN
ncbi:DUF3558 domain-containing protein [Actinokineospora xionganensis]|uniref:DUF3558 domain-containing protein n=1 Tax=Actinokineospora xionganensis TaxID=2684470 RepID=A0ABR7L5W7_9PSEU|nr:DUF3558 domain-containing protein [Actinokineospora xionganensis]MBC6448070.1 DUF3558 domain-containing protein [Actinokineospora xionganensis]